MQRRNEYPVRTWNPALGLPNSVREDGVWRPGDRICGGKTEFRAGKMKLAIERSNWRSGDGIQVLKNKIRGREMEFGTGKTELAVERSNLQVKNEIRFWKNQMSRKKMEFSIAKSESARNCANSTAEKPDSRRVLRNWDMGEDFFFASIDSFEKFQVKGGIHVVFKSILFRLPGRNAKHLR